MSLKPILTGGLIVALTLPALTLPALPAMADEGMWTFDNFPSAAVKAKYGVTIDQAWLDKVRGATVRIPGCSASLVSSQGLMLTNYHCVVGCAQALSTAEQNYMANGFLPATQAEEKRCPGGSAEILEQIVDVTAQVKAAGAGKTGSELVQATGATQAAIEKETCGPKPGYRCQVISMYGGGQYKLHIFKRYDDVRLAFAPEFKTGFFGGDPDNFNFPRYNLDFGLLRIYGADGKPLSTPQHLRWNPAPPKAGEPIFVVGNPGSTARLQAVSQLETQRDLTLPLGLVRTAERRGRIIRFSQESEENARITEDTIALLENGYKVSWGRWQALADPAFFGEKVRQENDLRAKVAANPALVAEIGDPWADLANIQKAYRELYVPFDVMNGPAGSDLFAYARTLVRAAQERPKPSGERLPEYSDSRLPLVERGILTVDPMKPGLEELNLGFWLSKAREQLTADDPLTKMLLGKESPESLAHRLVTESKLDDVNVRKALWEGGWPAIQASDDPMIKFVLAMDPAARDLRKQWEARVTGPTAAAQARIAKARFAIYGDSIYPDATFSPRITYGAIAGWTERGQEIAPFTTFAGLFERSTGKPPYDLPQSWYRARDKGLRLDTVFDFSGTLDIIGGNSGSPTLNARGEVIGVVFDGNIHSLGGNYGYDPRLNRSVHVSAAGMTEALAKVYGMDRLVAELNAK